LILLLSSPVSSNGGPTVAQSRYCLAFNRTSTRGHSGDLPAPFAACLRGEQNKGKNALQRTTQLLPDYDISSQTRTEGRGRPLVRFRRFAFTGGLGSRKMADSGVLAGSSLGLNIKVKAAPTIINSVRLARICQRYLLNGAGASIGGPNPPPGRTFGAA
jgi:hypothetical protein